jgi:RIO-like serine/threonine protein kinase
VQLYLFPLRTLGRLYDTGAMESKPWDADDALEALKLERSVTDYDVNDPKQVSDAVATIFRETAVVAAAGICHTALHEANARVRFDAQKFVIEEARKLEGSEADPLKQFIMEVYGAANGGPGSS